MAGLGVRIRMLAAAGWPEPGAQAHDQRLLASSNTHTATLRCICIIAFGRPLEVRTDAKRSAQAPPYTHEPISSAGGLVDSMATDVQQEDKKRRKRNRIAKLGGGLEEGGVAGTWRRVHQLATVPP